jgi:hypothetical protein
VDDTLCVVNTKDDALNLQQEIIALLGRGGFLLRKFVQVTQRIKTVLPDCREMEVPIQLDRNEAIKTLGLL